MKTIERALVGTLHKRLLGSPNLLQIVVGPRQVGKTTALWQLIKRWQGPSHYASADLPYPPTAVWIESQWQLARQEAQTHKKRTLLVLDEIQKIPRWGDTIKALVDEDHHHHALVRAVLLVSASLHVQKGAQESLAGRFELHFCPHWSLGECQEAFGWDLEEWLYYGGYPGAARLARSWDRWRQYISDSLVESVFARDVLQLTSIAKPALLRQLFMLAIHNPAQILSYNKMLGQLQDAGNTVTLAHYVRLLESAYLVSGLSQWSGGLTRHRASSPKFIIWNNALVNGLSSLRPSDIRKRPDLRGRLVENAVGAHILNTLTAGMQLSYWREGPLEVDFVLERGGERLALEVKSGDPRTPKAIEHFQRRYPKIKILLVGTGGIPLEKFFTSDPGSWF